MHSSKLDLCSGVCKVIQSQRENIPLTRTCRSLHLFFFSICQPQPPPTCPPIITSHYFWLLCSGLDEVEAFCSVWIAAVHVKTWTQSLVGSGLAGSACYCDELPLRSYRMDCWSYLASHWVQKKRDQVKWKCRLNCGKAVCIQCRLRLLRRGIMALAGALNTCLSII